MSDLKAIRKAAGMSQIQLSQRAKISRFRLSLAEANSLELRPEEMSAIRDAVRPEIQKTARLTSEFELRETVVAV